MYDKYSGRSRRFAFVTMSTIEDANAAIEKLNDTVSCNQLSFIIACNSAPWFYECTKIIGVIMY